MMLCARYLAATLEALALDVASVALQTNEWLTKTIESERDASRGQ